MFRRWPLQRGRPPCPTPPLSPGPEPLQAAEGSMVAAVALEARARAGAQHNPKECTAWNVFGPHNL